MPLFATQSDPGFTTKRPPLLANEGIDGVGMLPFVYGDTKIHDTILTAVEYDGEVRSLNDLIDDGIKVTFVTPGGFNDPLKGKDGQYGVPGKLYIQPCWVLKFMPYVNGLSTPIETSVTTTFTYSSQQAQSSETAISASLEASAGFEGFGITASVSASLSGSMTNSVSMQTAMEGSKETSESVELAAGSAFAIWDLRQFIRLENYYELVIGDLSFKGTNMAFEIDALAVQMYIDSCSIDQLPA